MSVIRPIHPDRYADFGPALGAALGRSHGPATTPFGSPPTGYARGTRILTPNGLRAVEILTAGDIVTDRNGAEITVLATLAAFVTASARLVCISENACGHGCPAEPVLLPPSTLMLVTGEALSLHFGLDEATVAVAALVNGLDIHWSDMALPTTWHTLSLDHPALLVVEGLLLGQGETDVPALTPAEGRLLTLAC